MRCFQRVRGRSPASVPYSLVCVMEHLTNPIVWDLICKGYADSLGVASTDWDPEGPKTLEQYAVLQELEARVATVDTRLVPTIDIIASKAWLQ